MVELTGMGIIEGWKACIKSSLLEFSLKIKKPPSTPTPPSRPKPDTGKQGRDHHHSLTPKTHSAPERAFRVKDAEYESTEASL
ncbi:MAG: hypothetical protein Q9181_005689 [Wetmoreana brouardii]